MLENKVNRSLITLIKIEIRSEGLKVQKKTQTSHKKKVIINFMKNLLQHNISIPM